MVHVLRILFFLLLTTPLQLLANPIALGPIVSEELELSLSAGEQVQDPRPNTTPTPEPTPEPEYYECSEEEEFLCVPASDLNAKLDVAQNKGRKLNYTGDEAKDFLLKCLKDKGVLLEGGGMQGGATGYSALRECNQQIMKGFYSISQMTGFGEAMYCAGLYDFVPITVENCEKYARVTANGGRILLQLDGKCDKKKAGHQVRVTKLTCDKENKKATAEFRDPNVPDLPLKMEIDLTDDTATVEPVNGEPYPIDKIDIIGTYTIE